MNWGHEAEEEEWNWWFRANTPNSQFHGVWVQSLVGTRFHVPQIKVRVPRTKTQ